MVAERQRLALRHVLPTDRAFLESLDLSGQVGVWRHGGTVESPHERVARFWQGALEHVLALHPATEEPIGYASAYDASLRHGTAWVAVVAAEEHRGWGVMLEAFGMFVTHLFCDWPFRKLYIQCADSELDAYRSAVARGILVPQGSLRGYRRIGARRHDVHLFSIERTTWMETWGKVVRTRHSTLLASVR